MVHLKADAAFRVPVVVTAHVGFWLFDSQAISRVNGKTVERNGIVSVFYSVFPPDSG